MDMTPDADETIAALNELVLELEEELERYRHVVYTLAMIDRDRMAEHDEALLEEAMSQAKELFEGEDK